MSALLGALIGGGASILANQLTSKAAAARSRQEFEDRTQHERTERLLAKGEELVGLLTSVGEWHTAIIDSALTPGHSKLLEQPAQPSRVEALTLAYFHEIDLATFYAFKVACAKLQGSIVEMLKTKLVPNSYQPSYNDFLLSASALQRAVLKVMQSTATIDSRAPRQI